ncbi:hypothetical protein AMTR_s00016p00127360 [Amborella trichopoda]|uniref:Uncharacterized protein n=1 Tax=Amborella trichopoda TaxID=13333 RepID=W1PES0_AMBTC|nr:hypothetical protein AMTR_s00016p00127360 [Amborella trichopoda]
MGGNRFLTMKRNIVRILHRVDALVDLLCKYSLMILKLPKSCQLASLSGSPFHLTKSFLCIATLRLLLTQSAKKHSTSFSNKVLVFGGYRWNIPCLVTLVFIIR